VLGTMRVSVAILIGRLRNAEVVTAVFLIVVSAWWMTRRIRRRARIWLRWRCALHARHPWR
jgi:hypothetical protein